MTKQRLNQYGELPAWRKWQLCEEYRGRFRSEQECKRALNLFRRQGTLATVLQHLDHMLEMEVYYE